MAGCSDCVEVGALRFVAVLYANEPPVRLLAIRGSPRSPHRPGEPAKARGGLVPTPSRAGMRCGLPRLSPPSSNTLPRARGTRSGARPARRSESRSPLGEGSRCRKRPRRADDPASASTRPQSTPRTAGKAQGVARRSRRPIADAIEAKSNAANGAKTCASASSSILLLVTNGKSTVMCAGTPSAALRSCRSRSAPIARSASGTTTINPRSSPRSNGRV